MKTVIVIPTIREANLQRLLAQWAKEFSGHHIIVVEDNPIKTFQVAKTTDITHYSWKEIDQELRERSWIIPRRTDCVRSFGFYKAYQMKPDMVITLDDDCYPDHEKFLEIHRNALQQEHYTEWFQHYPGLRVRGVPYQLETVPTVLNIGLWSHIPDLDAKTQLDNPEYRSMRYEFNYPTPKGYFAPVCGMNLAFKPEIIPAFYFLLMGQKYEYDRFGDIWAGIFLKKICDHLGFIISGGEPYVRHERASDPYVNLEKEKPGLEINERLWEDIKKMQLEGKNFKECYLSLARQLPEYSLYWKNLKEAMHIWANLF